MDGAEAGEGDIDRRRSAAEGDPIVLHWELEGGRNVALEEMGAQRRMGRGR